MNIKSELISKAIADFIIQNIDSYQNDCDKIATRVAISMVYEIKEIITNYNLSDMEMIDKIIRIFNSYGVGNDIKRPHPNIYRF